jgi:tungstate transport system permease protein
VTLSAGFGAAVRLLASGDREVFSIAYASLRFSLLSTIVSASLGVPLGYVIGLGRFRGRRVVTAVLNSLMAVPTVVIGLVVYSLISRSGPFGRWGLLFTPGAIVLGQAVLALPIVTSLVAGGLRGTDRRLPETLQTLGAGRFRILVTILTETRSAVLAAVIAGFGRVIGEVGVSMMLGGNIRWYTRTLTTAIALETSKGQFELGLALGMILLVAALVINGLLHAVVHDG